jgi:hypothetical protein
MCRRSYSPSQTSVRVSRIHRLLPDLQPHRHVSGFDPRSAFSLSSFMIFRKMEIFLQRIFE